MSRLHYKFSMLVGLLALLAGAVHAQDTVVHAVLLYSPACSHCHTVMEDVLPPLRARYGKQLEILKVNTQEAEGSALYQAALEQYKPAARGVPLLIVGEYVLVGSVQIPERFPGLIEHYLAAGGVAWPALPNLPGVAESALLPEPSPTAAPDGVLNLLYFQSPSCGGCRQLETGVLAELQTRYGDRLQLTAINTSDAAGRALYEAATARYRPTVEGVPSVILAETMLVGNRDVHEKLPALVEKAAASGGAPLPALPGLEELLAMTPTATPTPQVEAAPASAPWPLTGIAIVVLGVLALLLFRARR